MTTPNTIAKAIFDLIEAHQSRREPLVLAHVEAVVEQAMRPEPQMSDQDVMKAIVDWDEAFKAERASWSAEKRMWFDEIECDLFRTKPVGVPNLPRVHLL